ncbi:MAG: GNAT family N-acetyltransferase [Defluviitaleaceae bacterium]|nr:GNAT family N-acetyltransferase [Defluviitaleaceae bacterium]
MRFGVEQKIPMAQAVQKIKFSEFESERLIFRKFCEDDFSVLYSWRKDTENMGYRRDGVKTEEETRQHLEWIIAEASADECESLWFAVARKDDNKLIGEGILLHMPENPEMGWLVGKDHWQQGYGTEIGHALLKFCFQTLNLRRIIAACHVDNHASYKLMEKIGMRREAHFIQEKLYGDVWCDRYQYAILRDEWLIIQQKQNSLMPWHPSR